MSEKKKKTTGRRGNNEGSIYKRKDGRWRCQVIIGYTPEGKPTRKYVYGKSRQEVAQKLTLYNHTIIKHGYTVETEVKENIKLNPALKEWIVVFRIVDVVSSTVENLFAQAAHIEKEFGEMYISQITQLQCQVFFNKLGYSADYRKRVYSLFFNFMEYAKKQKWVKSNPLVGVKLRNAKNKQGRNREQDSEKSLALSPEQREELFYYLERDPVLKPILYTYTFASLRPGELPPLRWKHFDPVRQTLEMPKATGREVEFDESWNTIKRKQVVTETKTALGNRSNQIPLFLVNILLEWKQYQTEIEQKKGMHLTGDNDYIFPNKKGEIRTLSSIRSRLKRFLAKYGLPMEIHPYMFRHTFATMLLEQHENPKIVQKMMGHKKLTQTLGTYSHVIAKSLMVDATNSLGDAYNKFNPNKKPSQSVSA